VSRVSSLPQLADAQRGGGRERGPWGNVCAPAASVPLALSVPRLCLVRLWRQGWCRRAWPSPGCGHRNPALLLLMSLLLLPWLALCPLL